MAFKLPKSSTPFKKVSDSSFFTDSMKEGFSAGKYGTYSNPSLDPQTYAPKGLGEGIASAGEAIADAIANRKKAMTTSRDRPDFSNKIETPKPRTLKEGASPDLDTKIQTAKSRGNLKRAARLEGRQERRVERQTEGAERVKARQAKRTAKVKERQEKMTKKSLDTSVDGSATQMKDGSPNKFLGGIAGIGAALGRKAAASGNFDRAKYERLAQMSGAFGKIGQQILAQNPVADTTTQAQQAAAASASLPAGGTMGAAPIVPMTGGLVAAGQAASSGLIGAGKAAGGTIDPTNPFEGKTFQITPANMMGNAKPVFSEKTQGMAQAAFGSGLERQMSMPKSGAVTRMTAKQEKAFGPGSEVYEGGNTAIYEGLKAEDNSPAASYENPKTVIDDSHGYVASKAAEAFGQIAEKLIEKKKGDQDENE